MSLDTLVLLVRMAFRNLFAARLKTLIVGSIVFTGALLVVVGISLLESVNDGMNRSIVDSLAGNIQVYAAASKDKLEIFGNMAGFPDLAPVPDFPKVRDRLLSLPNVKAVVPMGINGAVVGSGNVLDNALERLRASVRSAHRHPTPAVHAEITARKALVRRMVELLEKDLLAAASISSDKAEDAITLANVHRATRPPFWSGFDADPLGSLEYLENKVAPNAAEADMLFVSYIGCDLEAFRKSFDRLEITDGTFVPPGRRGFLFAKFTYEEMFKVKIARRLDRIKEARETGGRRIATDPELKRFITDNLSQTHDILYQLDPLSAATVERALQRDLKAPDLKLEAVLAKLLAVDDANFSERYRIFYADVAPAIDLYKVRIGDDLTIKAVTRSGYPQSVVVKVYGAFQFRGLEKSALAGSMCLIDLVSLNELSGFPTSASRAEIAGMRKAAGARAVTREAAEAELFGGGAGVSPSGETPKTPASGVSVAKAGPIRIPDKLEGAADRRMAAAFTPADLDRASVLNAAVILKDPRRMNRTMREIEALSAREKLGLKVISWQTAAGLLGQLVLLMRIVLYVAVGIIFLVALIVLSNAFVMATLERVRDIGTLRAVGARREFIFAMIVVEAAVVGIIFGGAGAVAGGALVRLIGHYGIPATSDVMFFFFSGPRLRPFVRPFSVILAAVLVLVVNALSAGYPAWLAARVTPRQAMGAEE